MAMLGIDWHLQNKPIKTPIVQVEQLLKFTAEIDNSKLLTEPKVRVFDGEEAIVRIQKTVKYVSGYEEVKGFFGKPKEKTNASENKMCDAKRPDADFGWAKNV